MPGPVFLWRQRCDFGEIGPARVAANCCRRRQHAMEPVAPPGVVRGRDAPATNARHRRRVQPNVARKCRPQLRENTLVPRETPPPVAGASRPRDNCVGANYICARLTGQGPSDHGGHRYANLRNESHLTNCGALSASAMERFSPPGVVRGRDAPATDARHRRRVQPNVARKCRPQLRENTLVPRETPPPRGGGVSPPR